MKSAASAQNKQNVQMEEFRKRSRYHVWLLRKHQRSRVITILQLDLNKELWKLPVWMRQARSLKHYILLRPSTEWSWSRPQRPCWVALNPTRIWLLLKASPPDPFSCGKFYPVALTEFLPKGGSLVTVISLCREGIPGADVPTSCQIISFVCCWFTCLHSLGLHVTAWKPAVDSLTQHQSSFCWCCYGVGLTDSSAVLTLTGHP